MPLNQISDGQTQNALSQIPDGQIQNRFAAVPVAPVIQRISVPAPAPAPVVIQQSVPVPVPAPVVIKQTVPVAPVPVAPVPVAPVPVVQPAPVPVPVKESIQFAAIVHPGQVICPENRPCPQPVIEEVTKTVLQPVQKLVEVPVVREGIKATPKFEPVEVVRDVDVVREMQVEKQVVKPVCESCERNAPKTITVCAKCREAVDECSCEGPGGSYSRTYSNGKEAEAYSGPGYAGSGPVSTPGGLEAFFRQRMPEHFEH